MHMHMYMYMCIPKPKTPISNNNKLNEELVRDEYMKK